MQQLRNIYFTTTVGSSLNWVLLLFLFLHCSSSLFGCCCYCEAGLVASDSRVNNWAYCRPACTILRSQHRPDLKQRDCLNACMCRFLCQSFDDNQTWQFASCFHPCAKLGFFQTSRAKHNWRRNL